MNYLPSPTEIKERSELMLWMELMDWDVSVIDAVMYDDNPTPQTVRRLAYTHGPEKALQILLKMLE